MAGPDGDIFYVDINGGTIHRIQYFLPTAVISANPTSGSAPLTVNFDGSGSTDPDPTDTLTYAWDLNGDGNLRRRDDSADELHVHQPRARIP